MTRAAGDVRVVRVRPGHEDPAGARAWHAVVAASTVEDAPGAAAVGRDRFSACLAAGATLVWTASRGGRVVGLAMLRLSSVTSTGRGQVHVHPDHRGRGVGDRLGKTLVAEARGRGLSGLIMAVPDGGTGEVVCGRRGLVRVRTLHHLLLSLRDAHPGWLDAMVAAEHPGYRLADAARIAPPGDVLLTVAAEHGRRVVACTEVVVPPGGGRHRLGLDPWVKAVALPDGRERGFRPHQRVHEYRLDLTRSDARTSAFGDL